MSWELSGKSEELVQTVMLLGSNSKKERKTHKESVVEIRVLKIFIKNKGLKVFKVKPTTKKFIPKYALIISE